MRQIKIQPSITNRKDVVLDQYLADISHEPLISADEETALAQQIRKGGPEGEAAKNKLVTANLRFVVSVAKTYQCKDMMLSDLIDEGNIGLIRAAESFDETRGFKFISYAVWWIRQRIQQAIAEQSRIVRLPLNQAGLQAKLKQETGRFEQEQHRKPSSSELAEAMGIDEAQVETLLQADGNHTSIDASIHEDNELTISDTIASDDKADQGLETESLRTDLSGLFKTLLNDREIAILCACYGIGGQEKNYEEIGAEMGLTRERVRQIKERSLGKIRQSCGTKLLRKYLN